MKLNGRDLRFRRTIFAEVEVAKISPDRDPNRIAELLQGSFVEAQLAAASFIRILNEAHEKQQAFRDPDYEPVFLTDDDVLNMESDDFAQAFVEAYSAWAGEQPTVHAEPNKSKKKQGKKSSST
jgi:hypothetical protein